ncbi:galactose-1-phosphate uridylyltransferase [Sulfobacillus thermosulfidooxidans]|uniref:galactose-1-phosphate uridylyltransferase n=1 Tax=Sulfobacillus thermosulfidooxidans TaxID=28034 RepID=UPI0006B4CA75|nr:DUF4931 domain-containing protein [Sulfobacillus thermosulfidooxidans]
MIVLRQDPLTEEWVSLNADRQERPLTAGQRMGCPFCPGEGTEVGTVPFDVAVFENKFPAFHAPGASEVVVYSPHHHDDLAYVSPEHATLIWHVWMDRTTLLRQDPNVQAIVVFENRGGKVGASIAHPHGQIYAYPYIPPRLQREQRQFMSVCPLCDAHKPHGPLIAANEFWRIEVPYALRMPYQLWLVPKRHVPHIAELTDEEICEGVRMMQHIVRTYDTYFGLRTALVMALYQDVQKDSCYHFRWDFLPIDRGSGKIKYLAGSELAMDAFVVDMTPEFVATSLEPIFHRIHQEKRMN